MQGQEEYVRIIITKVGLLSLFCTVLLVGCQSKGPTRLCENFQSYQSVADVRALLDKEGMREGWREQAQGSSIADKRPPYSILYMTGPFRLLGVEGQLRLTFFNGRLMETQFSTLNGHDLIKALKAQHLAVPDKSAVEIVTDRHTRFRLDTGPDGTFRFTWYEPRLQNEWSQWVADHA